MNLNISPITGCNVKGKTVILRLDINSPIDADTKKIVNFNRIKKSLPTLEYLQKNGAKIAIIAHQGDTLDYQNLISMQEHAKILDELTGYKVSYIEDVCGPSAINAVKDLKDGESILLGNLRYLGEELSTFEKDVKLTPEQMTQTWLIRSLAPLADVYVNDAFAAAHRSSPSMIGFEEVLPSYAGFLFFEEYKALSQVANNAKKPTVFVLGGAKISDAFGMMESVLQNGTADYILVQGVTGIVMQIANGADFGKKTTEFLRSKDLLGFIGLAKDYISKYSDKIICPVDFAFEKDGERQEIGISQLPSENLFLDIGKKTIEMFSKIILDAATIFANGPAGVYEDERFSKGTEQIFKAIAKSNAFSIIGGGDTVTSASKFIDLKDISYVCTAGGAMVRFMSGKTLPLISAMQKAYKRQNS